MKFLLVLACILCLKCLTVAEDQIDQDDFTLITAIFEHSAEKKRLDRQQCADCTCGQANMTEWEVDSDEVPEGMYPWSVRVQFSNNETNICGGTVINDLYVLTAAHCVPSVAANISVFLKSSYPSNSVIQIEASSVKVHKDYVPDALTNDLALIKLSRKIDISIVSPICLPITLSTLSGKNATGIGWGFTSSGGPASDVCLRTYLPVLTKEDCDLEYGTLPKFMLCAGTDCGDQRICFGDSGGPLQIFDDNTRSYVQIGLSTWVARECGRPNGYSVFTKLAYYYDWIKSNTVDACYCSDPRNKTFDKYS